MKVVELGEHNLPGILFEIVRTIRGGGIALYPSEAGYVLTGRVNERREKRMAKIQRAETLRSPFIAVSDFSMLRAVAHIDLWTENILKALWPSPVSIGLFEKNLGGEPRRRKVFRMTDSYLSSEISRQAGVPLITAPAAIRGAAPWSLAPFIEILHEPKAVTPDLVVDAGALPPITLVTTLDLTNIKNPLFLRRGRLSRAELYKLMEIA